MISDLMMMRYKKGKSIIKNDHNNNNSSTYIIYMCTLFMYQRSQIHSFFFFFFFFALRRKFKEIFSKWISIFNTRSQSFIAIRVDLKFHYISKRIFQHTHYHLSPHMIKVRTRIFHNLPMSVSKAWIFNSVSLFSLIIWSQYTLYCKKACLHRYRT